MSLYKHCSLRLSGSLPLGRTPLPVFTQPPPPRLEVPNRSNSLLKTPSCFRKTNKCRSILRDEPNALASRGTNPVPKHQARPPRQRGAFAEHAAHSPGPPHRKQRGKHTAKHHRIEAHESRKVHQGLERCFLHGNSCLVGLLEQYMRAVKILLTALPQHQRCLGYTGCSPTR